MNRSPAIVFVMPTQCRKSFGGNTMQTDEKTVIEAVRRHIQGRTPGGAILEVLAEGVRQDHDWWYVSIRPSIQPARRYEYYETLSEVENEVQKSENITVLLIPALPK